MTVQTLCDQLELTVLAGQDGLSREVSGCYIGDLLSWVMSRAQEGEAWITVMGNVNAIAVAKLADLPCILLCESAELDAEAAAQADLNDIAILRSEQNAYRLALQVAELLEE